MTHELEEVQLHCKFVKKDARQRAIRKFDNELKEAF